MNVIHVNTRKFVTNFARLQSVSSPAPKVVIDIPQRIKRKPDDVLKALAALQTTDITSVHYQYHDDRYMIPYSNQRRKVYALSEESGRSAAKWLHKKYADLFKYSKGEPMIEAYVAGRGPEAFENVQTVEDLCRLMESQIDLEEITQGLSQIKDSRDADFKQAYFELVCFLSCQTNATDRFVSPSVRQKVLNATRNEEVDKLYKEFPPDDPRACNTMIRTFCRTYQVSDAWSLYQKALTDGIPVYLETFNNILQIVLLLNPDTAEAKWKVVEETLQMMASHNIKPNIVTMNTVLELAGSIFGWKDARQFSMAVLAEFKNLGIRPSLASWYHILNIFYRERSPMSGVLVDILDEIEKQDLEICDAKDSHFFVTAMNIATNQFQSIQLAYRINDLLKSSGNGVFIGDSVKESVYYRNFFQLICLVEPLDTFMDVYHTYVPSVYVPEPSVLESILKTVELNSATDQVPLLWAHIKLFEHTTRDNLINQLCRIIVNSGDEELAKIAVEIWDVVEENMETKRHVFKWKAQHLSYILTIVCEAKDVDRAAKIFKMIDESRHQIEGLPSEESLQGLYRLLVDKNQAVLAGKVVLYADENGLSVTNKELRV
ncbi:small ribosomal subunit protein mS39 [Phlebotomus argentipes]|uniref:small ribosomal subunit protein mS39 n=1 Tax=Phlebotomus argentipes TaxID=94469 RepID=UPI002892FBC3|nr:small ribosomal subunit protein mS39 [Phlebotomus argentipes]